MVKSMFTGVSGIRAHQTRMDTIGDNIANVNTYGFKSSRTSFRDIYYQQTRGAAQPDATEGGINPSSVGYGSKVGSIDLLMSRSTFSMTDQSMDMAIDGEGFFQVQDASGNTYYTRAGALSFDAAGNLVDSQGNYVLGVNGDPSGRGPSSERISISLGPVIPAASKGKQTINGKEFTVSASNQTEDGNLSFSFTTDASLADGEVQASMSATGIVVKMNPQNSYSDLENLNDAINAAILRANDGKPHPAGTFKVSYTGEPSKAPFSDGKPLTAKEICSTSYGIDKGSMKFTNAIAGGITPSGTVGNTFGKNFATEPASLTALSGKYSDINKSWDFEMTIGGVVYKGSVDSSKNTDGRFKLFNVNGDENDYIEMNRPSFDKIGDAWAKENGGDGKKAVFNFSAPSAPLVAGQQIKVGDTTYTVSDDAGVRPAKYSITAPASGTALKIDGTSYANTGTLADLVAAINADAASSFTASEVDGKLQLTAKTAGLASTKPDIKDGSDNPIAFDKADMGSDGDLSKQMKELMDKINADANSKYSAGFADGKMTLTARDPKFVADTDAPAVIINGAGATLTTVENGADTGKSKFKDGVSFDLAPDKVGNPTATSSKESKALGLSSGPFVLRGGTKGGEQTLADMTGIEIGTNGVITGWDKVGNPVIVGRIDLATFANASGLNQVGSSNFGVSANSGKPVLTAPGSGGGGQLVSGSLELSNVDLSREFSDMITTQRGYQANSRIVTVSDTMLEELINMKR